MDNIYFFVKCSKLIQIRNNNSELNKFTFNKSLSYYIVVIICFDFSKTDKKISTSSGKVINILK